MARTFLRQDVQIGQSVAYNATLAAGTALQTGALSLQDDLNALRTQVNRLLAADFSSSWTSDVATVNGKKRSVNQLNFSLDGIESKPLLFPVQSGSTLAIPAGQNFIVLSVAGNQTPTQSMAIGATTSGAVVAQSASTGSAFAANELTAQVGTNALAPKNLCRLHDSVTGQVLNSSDADIYGLIQVEAGAADGASFSDTAGSRVKLSFVKINYASMTLVSVPAADIGGKSLNYTYRLRTSFGTLPEDFDLTSSTFSDQVADLDVTLSRAAINQMGSINVPSSLLWQVANGQTFKVQDAGGAHDIFSVVPGSGNNALTLSPDILSVATTTIPTSTKGWSVATGSQQLNLGVTTGQIDSAGLALVSTGTNTLKLTSGQAINLKDTYQTGSGWISSGINLSASTADWTLYRTTFGEVSLLAGINAAATHGNHGKKYGVVVPATIAAGTNVTGGGASPNLDNALFDYSQIDFLTDLNVFYNGVLMRPGANASANFDYYPGTVATNGDLIFNFALRGGATNPDCISQEVFGSPSAP
jgi:hypothetical protein